MFKRVVLGLFILAAVAVSGYYVITRYLTSDEDRVRGAIGSLVSHLERESHIIALLGIERCLSDDYRHRGEFRPVDKTLALQYLNSLKLTYVDFKVQIREMTVTIRGDTAQVHVTGRVTAAAKGSPGRRIEVMTQPGRRRAVIDLAKQGSTWKVVGSQRIRHALPD